VLFVKLWTKSINACGTVRGSRKHYPVDLLVQKVDRGYYDYRSLGPLLACVWMDKRVIRFLTTLHAASQDVTHHFLSTLISETNFYKILKKPGGMVIFK